ncbi:M14 family metallopeptidase [Streptomyces sp. NPDC001450]
MTDPNRYLNVEEVESALSNLAASFPSLCELIELPHRTVEGRTCHAIRLRNGMADNRPAIFFTGGLHAREWGSCEILINLATDLLRAFTDHSSLRYGGAFFAASDVQVILNRLDILLFPQVNPDGRHYSLIHDTGPEEAHYWRKNRNPANSGGRSECVGVDINRNFDFLFDFDNAFSPLSKVREHTSTDPCDHEEYHGPAPFSEPETQNVKFLFDSHPEIRWFGDIHSYSQDFLFAWGDDDSQTIDASMHFLNSDFDGKRGVRGDAAYGEFIKSADLEVLRSIAETFINGVHLVRGKFYSGMPSANLYPTSGTSDDYASSRHSVDSSQGKIFAFVVEWGKEFHPLWEDASGDDMLHIVADVTAGLIAVCRDSALNLPGVRGVPALIQSNFGGRNNFECAAPLERRGIGHASQNKAGSFFWDFVTRFAVDVGFVDAVSLIQSTFGPGNFEVVARIGDQLKHFFRESTPPFAWFGPIPIGSGVSGTPAFIQSNFGPGNFEVVTPMAEGGLAHFFRADPGTPWLGPARFATEFGHVEAVSLIQSTFGPGNFEVAARIGDSLHHFSRGDPGTPWSRPMFIADGVTGNPVLLQSDLGHNGNFELVTPLREGGLGHFARFNDEPALPWRGPTRFGTDLGMVDAVTMIQSTLGPTGLEVIARVGSTLREFTRDNGPAFQWVVTGPPEF